MPSTIEAIKKAKKLFADTECYALLFSGEEVGSVAFRSGTCILRLNGSLAQLIENRVNTVVARDTSRAGVPFQLQDCMEKCLLEWVQKNPKNIYDITPEQIAKIMNGSAHEPRQTPKWQTVLTRDFKLDIIPVI